MAENRDALIKTFLQLHGWGKAKRIKIAGDASFRRYERVELEGSSAILMDAPPEHEDVMPFVKIANHLLQCGLSAPAIYAQDEKTGLLLLEDLGNESFTKVLAGQSPLSSEYNEEELYKAAIDVLLQLHRAALPSDVPEYDDALLLREAHLLTDWFLPNIGLDADVAALRREYETLWKELYPRCYVGGEVLVLRDYHADNLMWLPDKHGTQAVGLLDFQDAVIGSPAYDLVSLLEDARRDVAPETQDAMITYYLNRRSDIDREAFKAAYAILGAQRNCKIIGIFSRLALRDNKPRYLSYLPRVWKHLEHDVSHPVLASLKFWLDTNIPQDKRQADSIILPKNKEAARA